MKKRLLEKNEGLTTQLLDCISHATQNTFRLQCGGECFFEAPFSLTDVRQIPTDLIATIDVKSPEQEGKIALCFPEQTYLRLIDHLFGEKHNQVTSEISDGASEILNMIFGHVKSRMKEEGTRFEMAIPRIESGLHPAQTFWAQAFKIEQGTFHVLFFVPAGS